MNHISILIVTKNRRDLLEACLASLGVTPLPPVEIVVVDNASDDGTKQIIQRFKKVLPIKYLYTEISGYPAVYNLGISHCRGRFVVFLDDDCVVAENWYESMMNASISHPKDIVQGKIISSPKGNVYAEVMGDHYQNWITSHSLSKNQLDCFDNKNLIVPRNVFSRFGMFDESFTHGSEDLELSHRFLHQGIHIYYNKTIIASHTERTTLYGFVHQHLRIAMSEAYLDKSNALTTTIGITSRKRARLYIASIRTRIMIYCKEGRIASLIQLPFLYAVLIFIRVLGYQVGKLMTVRSWRSSII